MPFQRPRFIAALALTTLAGIAIVLYVIQARTVHVRPNPPPELARLAVLPSPEPTPKVAFASASGLRATLAAFRGHYVLLNLWATWCAPCVRELPELARLKSALPGLEVIAVNVGRDSAAQTGQFLASHQAADLSVFVDPDATLIRAFNLEGLPFSVLVDAQGNQIARALGPCDWSAPAAVSYLRELVTPRASS